jgi:small nuclear ribonucleoprotein (snRNP)-like protein
MCASFFKTLVEHEITVELKNEVQIRGTLKSVDQYLNIKLDNAEAVDELRWPHLVRRHSFILRWVCTASGRMCEGACVCGRARKGWDGCAGLGE